PGVLSRRFDFLSRYLIQIPLAGQEIGGIQKGSLDFDNAESIVPFRACKKREQTGEHVGKVNGISIWIDADDRREFRNSFSGTAVEARVFLFQFGHLHEPCSPGSTWATVYGS